MRVAFVITAFLLTYAGFSQDESQLRSKAYNFYSLKKQYDSALFYFLKVNQSFPGSQPISTCHIIAQCYMELSDTGKAEEYYLQALALDNKYDNFGDAKTATSAVLSKLYFSRKQYREALDYLIFTKTKYKPGRVECNGLVGYNSALSFAYDKSLCYYGLGEKDSALSELAPLIFRQENMFALNKKLFENATIFFVNTVIEVYGATKAKHDLQQAVKKSVYKPSYHERRSMDSSLVIIFSVDYSIHFGKIKINLGDYGGRHVKNRREIPQSFSKEELLREFTSSPAYQYLMKCNSEPVTFKVERQL